MMITPQSKKLWFFVAFLLSLELGAVGIHIRNELISTLGMLGVYGFGLAFVWALLVRELHNGINERDYRGATSTKRYYPRDRRADRPQEKQEETQTEEKRGGR